MNTETQKQKIILVDAVNCFVSNTGEINQEMYQMLEQFNNSKIIVTNAPDEKMSEFGLDKAPYPVFSLNKNPPKTNTEYWKIFLEKHNLKKNDVVYFEHSIDAIEAAKAVGIDSFFYDHTKNNIYEVKEFLEKTLKPKD